MEGDEVMITKSILASISVGLVLIFSNCNLIASPIDLSTFTAYPGSAVVLFDEGFSATISEDAGDNIPDSLLVAFADFVEAPIIDDQGTEDSK